MALFPSNKPSTRQPADPSLVYEAYIDESSQTKHRYLCLGGLLLKPQLTSDFEDHIKAARMPELPYGELAWTKVSKSKLPAYQRVVDRALDLLEDRPWHQFHVVVVNTFQLKDGLYNQGNRYIGFNKEIYQLYQKFGRLHRSALFHIYLDGRSTKNSLEELRTILNFGIRAKQSGRDWPYRRVQFRDSSKCHPIQVVDILLGAVAFHLNGHRRMVGASDSKCYLSDHILNRVKVTDVWRDTATSGPFTIWHRRLN